MMIILQKCNTKVTPMAKGFHSFVMTYLHSYMPKVFKVPYSPLNTKNNNNNKSFSTKVNSMFSNISTLKFKDETLFMDIPLARRATHNIFQFQFTIFFNFF